MKKTIKRQRNDLPPQNSRYLSMEQTDLFKKIAGHLSMICLLILTGIFTTQTFAQTCTSPPSDLVSWYRAENNALDTQGNNNGTLQNGATFANGYVNQAFSLDGVDDRVMIPASSSLDVGTSDGFTIETWINPNNATDSNKGAIAEYNNGSQLGAHLFISSGTGGPGAVFANIIDTSGNTHAVFSAPNIVTVNQWQHIAVTYDKTTRNASVYRNGVEVGQANLGIFTPQTTYDLYLGARIGGPFGTSFFDGEIDEVSLYNRSLSAAEIADIVAADTAGKCVPTETFTVTNTNDSGASSLRQALADAQANAKNDNIVFDSSFNSPQTITLTSGVIEYNPTDDDELTINGPGANLLTIDANNNSRIFIFRNDSPKNIIGMTLTNGNNNGNGTSGGAIFDDEGGLNLQNMVITGNTSVGAGGGVFSEDGTITLDNVTLSNNTSLGAQGGGGLFLFRTTDAQVSNSTIDNNTANSPNQRGGGIYCESGNLIINNSTISNNSATLTGGGIHNQGVSINIISSTISSNTSTFGGGLLDRGSTSSIISNSTISNNTSTNQGGGIHHDGAGTLNITDSTISGNTTAREGGGMFATNGTITITGSTFSNNSVTSGSPVGGGGIGFFSTTATATNSTISGNTSTGPGGGIRNASSNLTFTNLTIANNSTTSNGGGIVGAATLLNTLIGDNSATGTGNDLSGSFTSNGYNLIEDTNGASIGGDTATNITGSDPMLAVLADNGGPTETHALMQGSPAIDAADPNNFPATDQRGNLRPADGNFAPIIGNNSKSNSNLLGALPDIGAFERLAPTAASVSVSGRVTIQNRGIPRVAVTLTDSSGNTLTARTNQFGYFRFDNIDVGQTYIAGAFAKQYTFAQQVINVDNDLTDLNFSPIGKTSGKSERQIIKKE